jgi:hypothetical protein
MQKKITKPTPTKEIIAIDGTRYVILPDNTVARLLKSRIVHGTTRFNLIIDGKFKTVSAEELREWNANRNKPEIENKETETQ